MLKVVIAQVPATFQLLYNLALELSFKNTNQAGEAYINLNIRVARVTFQRAGPISP